MSYTLNIETLIFNRQIMTHFQPLVSVRQGVVIGYEALSRGTAGNGELLIPPDTLFTLAELSGLSLQLDRACREMAFTRFAPLHKKHKEQLLFVNVDASLLTESVVGSGHIEMLARSHGINPANVVIEIIESHVQDTAALMRFINRHRALGFLIALDDVGAGHSNLERIASIKPEVIKIDRFLISNIHTEFYKQEVVNSLTSLARRIGAMTVAEGVEKEEEAVYLMGAGADVLQGYLFARPCPTSETPDVAPQMRTVAAAYRSYSLNRYERHKEQQASHRALIRHVRETLGTVKAADFTKALVDQLLLFPSLECLYVLDETGIQVSDTLCNPLNISANKQFIYQPARKGTDHSLKEYFIPIQAGLEECVTAPYISLASGNRCITLATRCTCAEGKPHVLCLDVMERGNMAPLHEQSICACGT